MHIKSDRLRVLVVGGAGFIGSHMVLALNEAGYQPVVFDNLSKGHRDAVLNAELIEGDMSDAAVLSTVFQAHAFHAVMHFASYIEVGESVRDPGKYYNNNVCATLTLLESMLKHDVKRLIFSSTAAVYGEPQYTPIDEKHPLNPLNPYGKSKRMVEEMLADFSKSDGLRYATLRYFNAAGADPLGRLRERHEPESHLIPLALQVATGERDKLVVNGRDYPTRDGTCVRDYVHVTDLCAAHLLALKKLDSGLENLSCNLGINKGYTVQEVIDVVSRVTGKSMTVESGPRRAGDPAVLVADASLAQSQLGWLPRYDDLEVIVQHAYASLRK